ncbi:MAG: acetylglutamate kinase [Bacteroidaceae bacterium]|nr:acetylglutamate kinase [Bacteroidaceae bacterium]
MKKITIIKVGGAVVEDSAQLNKLLDDFSHIQGAKILVHGGGRTATKIAERLNIETKMVGGRRITDKNMLEIVTMVYGGLVNKNIVARLQSRSLNAIGLTGADGNVLLSHKREVKDVDYGYVGDIDKGNLPVLSTLINAGLIPVIAPLTHDGKGNLLNTNADTIAAEIAKTMATAFDVTLIYAFEKPGVMENPDDDKSVIPLITAESYIKLKERNIVSGGMIPKIDNAFNAIKVGVKEVVITKADSIDGTKGTKIVQ